MYLAYVDESGNSGPIPGGTRTYTLGCLLVPSGGWPSIFDEILSFRRFVREKFGVPVRAEIKANHILRNRAAFAPLKLSEEARYGLYRQTMRLLPKVDIPTFAVVIDKEALQIRDPGRDARDVAWEYLLQRLERFSTKRDARTGHGGQELLLIHDEGEQALVRKLARRARRAGTAGSMFGTGTLKVPARLLIEDPFPKDSKQSYFLQLADMAAYAAFRKIQPASKRIASIVPSSMWDEIGSARFTNVSHRRDDGIVLWPD